MFQPQLCQLFLQATRFCLFVQYIKMMWPYALTFVTEIDVPVTPVLENIHTNFGLSAPFCF